MKALAVSCMGAAVALHPEAFFNTLYLEPLDGTAVGGEDTHTLSQYTHTHTLTVYTDTHTHIQIGRAHA